MLVGNYSRSSILEFWHELRTLDAYSHHPARDTADAELCRTLPICLHADGAEMYRDNEYFVWSWSSGLSSFGMSAASPDVLMHKMPICVVSEHDMLDPKAARLHVHECFY